MSCFLSNNIISSDQSDQSFKVTVLFKGKYLKNGAFYVVQLQIIHLSNLQCNVSWFLGDR